MVTYRETALDNGLRVVTAHSPFWRSLALGVFAGAGSRHDPAPRQGLAHFTEHMLFKGTSRRSAKRIVTEAESVGGSLNAYTSEEHTCYHVRSPATQLRRMVLLIADMYLHSTFLEAEIQRERQVIEDEILMYRDEPSAHIDDLLSAVVWPGHALGRPVLGTLNTLARIERQDFLAHLKRSYGARNTVVALAGPQPHEEMIDAVAAGFQEMMRGRRRVTTPFRDGTRKPCPRLFLEERTTEQIHLRLAFHTGGRLHPHVYSSRLLSVLLGETMSSRLSQELREKRGYCYTVGSSRDVFQDTGIFGIHASFEPRFLRKILTAIFRQLRRLREQPPGARELKTAFQFLAGNHDMGLEETCTQMFWIGDAALHQDEDLDPETFLKKLSLVNPEQIHQAAREIFTRENLRVALLGPGLERKRSEVSALCHDLL